MAAVATPIDVRDYLRVFFSRAWWFLFVTLGVAALMFYYSFYMADRTYEASNEIKVTDKYSGTLSKDIGRNPDWIARTDNANTEFKRPVRARGIIADASKAVGMPLTEEEISAMVSGFKNEMKVTYSKRGDLIEISYRAKDARLAAAVLNLFVKRLVEYCVTKQVEELNNKVETLSGLRAGLEAEVAAAQRALDRMKTIAPELQLASTTMYLLQDGRQVSTTPTTEQKLHVFLRLERDRIALDSDIADRAQQIEVTRELIDVEPEAVPAQRKLEALPAVREALTRREQLRFKLAQLLSNSTAEHPLVKQTKTELKSLDAFLQSAASQTTVEIVFETNARREELRRELAALERELEGLKVRRESLQANAAEWGDRLEKMPAELRTVQRRTLEYDKKVQSLSVITDRLVQAQIMRRLELDQVGTYYRPQYDLTPVPSAYRRPNHALHLAFGLTLGVVTSVFVVYATEFADHSVKDMRDLKVYTKAAVLGVISDYNQLKSVATRAVGARAKGAKTYLLALLFFAFIALLIWVGWQRWPRPNGRETLPAVLSMQSLRNVDEAMGMYTDNYVDLTAYMQGEQPQLDVAPAIVTGEEAPEPLLSQ
ncbi:MAG: GumC family protein [Planctomycetota bacterium]|jgi:uncharacterized protein involved in exopolysaccharide biosynthesis